MSADSTRLKEQNLLEWLSSIGMPDSIRALIVSLFAALTLTPYLGGTTIGILSSSPIPTVSAVTFWILLFLTPVFWSVIFVRVIKAPARRIVVLVLVVISFSCATVVAHVLFPSVALSAINQNFDQTFQLGFQRVRHTWVTSRDQGKYCHFRTSANELDKSQGCSLRIDKVSVEGGGEADVSRAGGLAAFDLEVFAGSGSLLPETTECVEASNWPSVTARPNDVEVLGHTIIIVERDKLGPRGSTDYAATYDFVSNSASASPRRGQATELRRRDIFAKEGGARVQLSGWTLWGDPVAFRLSELAIRVVGRMQCGPATWFAKG